MFGSSEDGPHLPRAADFYNGRSVLLTGAAGFVGSVILETLLRCCPGIKCVYILLRPKRNAQPEARKEQIFSKRIFEKLKAENEELMDRVQVIAGDGTLPNLGMSEENVRLLVEEVSIVFHCAAVINFTKSLEFTLSNNVLSLHTLIEMCRKMKKFEVLVYTSTAYSNCNRVEFPLEEEVYRLPFRAEIFIDALKNKDSEKLQELLSCCKPEWPNMYTFSKCLAENVVADTASDLPVAIIRPSIVMNTWKQPIPGYVEENSGIAALSIGTGKGFIKVLHADPNCRLNLVPVDIVANTHVLAAMVMGTKRSSSPLVVNCSATEKLNVTLHEYSDIMTQMTLKFPLPKAYKDYSHLIIVPNRYLYCMVSAYHHYIPAIVLDGMLKILGKKPRLYSMYHFYDTIMSSLGFFLQRRVGDIKMEKKNIEALEEMIHPEDEKNLSLDFRDASFLALSMTIPGGSPFYDWKVDEKSQSERKRLKHRRHLLVTGIQWSLTVVLCLLVYWLFSSFFR